ncbi:MAG TPA: NRAMP family divalent metal transporter [Pyrinomonadaceae bacterium]|nr:NRAMP family divalent metal transporter [Pyrinomonadaceae bacterium]
MKSIWFKNNSTLLGAAFLMATSAIGPGFLTQTTVFTNELLASFGFVILLSVILDIFAQMNIWRIVTVNGRHAQDIANTTVKGSGYLLSILVFFGGLIFNIGNVAGTGLGMNAMFGLDVATGAAISSAIAIAIFVIKDAGRAMDAFVKLLGILMILFTFYVVYKASPPVATALHRTLLPETIDFRAVITLVGGTVGGYITFAGAHRLIDAGKTGTAHLKEIDKSAVVGICLTAIFRYVLFLAALGVFTLGYSMDAANPAASVFQSAAGIIGYKIFGFVMWCAAITSVVGASYTSITFIKTFSLKIAERQSLCVIIFIIVATLIFLVAGRPVSILIFAGTVNGFILPIGLALMLISAKRNSIGDSYRHPLILNIGGWFVVILMTLFSILSLPGFGLSS